MPISTLEMMRAAFRSATVGKHHLTKGEHLKKATLTLAFALLLLCTGTGAALAQTPDGFPPALETVCDNETGAAYGHCNAYCEAMDCELANDNDPLTEPHASATACSKVRNKFEQATGHDVPCEVSCPCTSIPEFNAALAGANYCYEDEGVVSASPNPILPPFFFDQVSFSNKPGTTASGTCGYLVLAPTIVIVLPITPEQAAVCEQVVRDAIASRELTCTTPE